MQTIIQNDVPTGKPLRQTASARSSTVGELPDCSVRSLASSAQNRIGCSKIFVTSRHLETPPTPPLDTLSKNLNPSPYGARNLFWTTSKSHQISIQEMAPEYRFSATGYFIVSCWLHYWQDCTVCAISRKE